MKQTKTSLIKNCDKDKARQSCIAEGGLVKEISNYSKSCPKICIPSMTKAYFDYYEGEDNLILQPCDELIHDECMINETQKYISNGWFNSRCRIQCTRFEYNGKDIAIDSDKFQTGNNSATLALYYGSDSRTVLKEYWIYDEIGLIGNLGGSLGLIMGFSVFGFISDILDVIQRKISK